MALTDIERSELETAIQALGGNFADFTFQEFRTNPTKYAGNTQLRLIQIEKYHNKSKGVEMIYVRGKDNLGTQYIC